MKVGIIGATGLVGQQMLTCLEESSVEIDEIRLFASDRSKGTAQTFKGEEITVDVASPETLKDLDYVFGAVSNELSKEYATMVKQAGAIYIDNSSAFRLEDDVPLVIPEINGEDAKKNNGIIANPNCSTIITLMAVAPISKLSEITSMTATTFQAVSGAGVNGLEELTNQTKEVISGEEPTIETFPTRIAFNCIPQIGDVTENGYTTEEMKMQNEGRKILHLPDLKVTCTCVRVPVLRSHSISATVVTKEEVSLEEAKKSIEGFPGVQYFEDKIPTPMDSSNQNDVFVGRLRKDLINDNGISLWCCGDQIRKGAAANAVAIMEYLLSK